MLLELLQIQDTNIISSALSAFGMIFADACLNVEPVPRWRDVKNAVESIMMSPVEQLANEACHLDDQIENYAEYQMDSDEEEEY